MRKSGNQSSRSNSQPRETQKEKNFKKILYVLRTKELESPDWKDPLYSAYESTSKPITMGFQSMRDKKRRCWKLPEKIRRVTHQRIKNHNEILILSSKLRSQEVKGAMSSRLSKGFSPRHLYTGKLSIKCAGRMQLGEVSKHLYPGSYWRVCSNKQKKTSGKKIKFWRWCIQLWEGVKEF